MNKLNNKGFAITTILYGILIIFCMLLVSLLGILSTLRHNLQLLIDEGKGTREIVTMKAQKVANINTVTKRGLYCQNNTNECRYVSNTPPSK